MKRIYLRLIDVDHISLAENQRLINVKNAVDQNVTIKWLQEPELHIKGGYVIIGEVAADIDLDSLAFDLKNTGFLIVI